MDSDALLRLVQDPAVPVTRIHEALQLTPRAAAVTAWRELQAQTRGADAATATRLTELRKQLAGRTTVLRALPVGEPSASSQAGVVTVIPAMRHGDAAVTVPPHPVQTDPVRVDSETDASVVPATGTRLSQRYRLVGLIGRGGMGQVWEACDTLLERAGDPNPLVAVKLLNGDFEQHPNAYVALQREATRAIQLAHPNIAIVRNFEEDPATSRPYIVMELLTGQPLNERLDQAGLRGLARAEALPIIRGLAGGLAYAHAEGIVHCDFKPGNAFVTREGVAKVLDFGIARAVKNVSDDTFDAGSLRGLTEPYASLEMLREPNAAPHPADDVYALGLVAYEILTGRHPFDFRSAEEARTLGLRPARIRGLSYRQWRAIARAIAFDRAARPADAGVFLKSLAGINRWAIAAMAVALVALAMGCYTGYQHYVDLKPRVPFASLPANIQAEFNADMAEGNQALAFLRQGESGSLSAFYAGGGSGDRGLRAYAAAYALHPKNPDADRALREGLTLLERGLAATPAERDGALQNLEQIRDDKENAALARYPPLLTLIEHLKQPPVPAPR